MYGFNDLKTFETDFRLVAHGANFPTSDMAYRLARYNFNERLYNGDYARDKKLTIGFIDKAEQQVPYTITKLNYFKLLADKMEGLIFGNEITVKTGKFDRDKVIQTLIEKTLWAESIRIGIKKTIIYGDYILKTYKDGVSAFSPSHCFKVVDINDKDRVRGFVMHSLIYEENNKVMIPKYIRFEIHAKGIIQELAFNYMGNEFSGTVGTPATINYNGRSIPIDGNIYRTGIDDCECVQWLSVNKDISGIYGKSNFDDIKDIVFALEQRLASERWIMNEHEKPLLVVGMNNIVANNKTGEYELKAIDEKYIIAGDDSKDPKYITWDGKLDNSQVFRQDLVNYFYELSEMGKTFLSGEYSGNVSEETILTTIKSAVDKANRLCTEMWYDIRKSLYVLCRLNNIEISIDEININFNVGRVEDDSKVATIAVPMVINGILSRATVLERYLGYSKEQADTELETIRIEREGVSDDTTTNAPEPIWTETKRGSSTRGTRGSKPASKSELSSSASTK